MSNHNQTKPNKKISTLIGILIIVVFALIVGGAIYWYSKEKFETPEVKVSEKTITDETANWKTYRNEEYGFEVKYPSNWQLSTIKNDDDSESFSLSPANETDNRYQFIIQGRGSKTESPNTAEILLDSISCGV